MSDASQGPGWWQASDGKWYPPEQAPGGAAASAGGGGGGGPVSLDIGAAFGYGWNKFVQYIGQIIVIAIVIFAVQILFYILRSATDSIILATLLSLIGWIVGLMLQLGLVRAALAITRGEAPDVSMLFQTDHLGPYLIASVFYGILVFIGFLALCIGAFVVAFFLLFYGFYILDREQGPTESLGSSFNLVKDNFGQVFGYVAIAVLLNCCTFGLASPIVQIANGYVYKTLNGEPVAA